MKLAEANRRRLCMICGRPDANLLRLSDGRNVRACDECLRADEHWTSYKEREPLPSEVSTCQDCGERPADPTRDDERCRECGEDIDAMYANLIAAAPELLAALRGLVEANEAWNAEVS